MKRVILLLMLFAIALPAASQSKQHELTSGETTALQKRWKENAATIKSIDCDFVQTKRMEVFKKEIRSTGHFQFRRENKIRMDYAKPAYEMIINGNRLKVTSNGRSNVIETGSNQMISGLGKSLSACMTGDVSKITASYKLSYYSDNKEYKIRIVPKSEELKEYISELQVTLARKDLSVTSLILSEADNNTTIYRFTKIRYNTLTNDSRFAIE